MDRIEIVYISLARQIVEEHWELCLTAGINHEGINAEVAKGQWEFQIFAKGSAKAADDTWTALLADASL
jgi:glutamine synthetase